MIKKLVIDYGEWVRLKEVEKKYHQLKVENQKQKVQLDKKNDQSGQGMSADLLKQNLELNNGTEQKIASLDTIAVPVEDTVPSKLTDMSEGKKLEGHSNASELIPIASPNPWYYCGVP